MPHGEQQAISRQVFQKLVSNGLDFLERAPGEVEDRPKYALIFFASGVELLLKAHLALEHWSLIFVEPAKAQLKHLESGEFRSVASQDIVDRIRNIALSDIPRQLCDSLKDVALHRNQLLHFYATEPELGETVAEMCRCWHHLHIQLLGEWDEEFGDFVGRIHSLHDAYRGLRQYFEFKREEVADEVEELKKRGTPVGTCFVCGSEAVPTTSGILDECLVCGCNQYGLHFRCRSCKKWVDADTDDSAKCVNCGLVHSADSIASAIVEFREEAGFYAEDLGKAWCGSCGFECRFVSLEESGEALCLGCGDRPTDRTGDL